MTGSGSSGRRLLAVLFGGALGLLGGTVGKHIRSDLDDVQTRYDATLRALADPAATAEQRARLAQSTADMADWASRRLDELAPANARQAAAQTQRALADIAERMKPLTLDETGEPIIDPLKLTDSEWTSGADGGSISVGSSISQHSAFDDREMIIKRIIDDPKLLGTYDSPDSIKSVLEENGYEVKPLGRGSFKGVRFENGGGFRVNFGDGGLLQYHPEANSHHGGAYYKISTGKGGVHHYDINGNEIEP